MMDISITDINDVRKEIQVTAYADELAPHFEKAYKDQLPKIEIKGFRKGRVPLDLVKKLHGEAIEHQSLDTIVNDVYRQVIQERNIQPIGDPILTKMDYRRGEALTFKITYEIAPVFELGEYKGISVEKPLHKVTDGEVENEILRLRRSDSTMSEVPEVADDEHVVTVDIQETDPAGSPLIGRKTTDARVHLADDSIYADIKSALRHAATGSTHRVTVTAEKEGKKEPAHLEISVKKVEKMNLPELDAEFAKKLTKGKIQNPVEFRKHLREDLERYWEDRSERVVADSLIGEVARRHEFTIPETLVKGILDSLQEEFKNRHPGKKLPGDFDEKDFREKNRAYAVFQAKWFLIRERIIEAEKIGVDEADLEQLAGQEASKLGIEKERLVKFYQSSDAVKNRIISDKLLAFLKTNAHITEKVVDDHDGGRLGSTS
jgi:trigger factor